MNNADYKAIVQLGYDRCAGAYAAARRAEPGEELPHLADCLPNGAHVLDIGCGAGIPIARALAARFHVTGIDLSGEQIRLARQNVPDGHFIHGDIMAVNFGPAQFDAAVAYYSIFHLPLEEHPLLFRRLRLWLKPGGYLLAALTHSAEAGYVEDDFFGVSMFWSNLGLDDYQALLAANGFQVLHIGHIGHGYGSSHPAPLESHPYVLARNAIS